MAKSSPLDASGSNAPAFSCQRFWVPRTGGMIDLSDGGFLRDPTGLFARSDAAGARQLRELAGYRALALLGEPGIGKSTTLSEEAARVGEQAGAGTVSIHADLRAYSSESLLYRRIFESDEFLAWETGHSHLVLHLDSLDEALLRIDSIANLLTDELPRCPVERLSVRIACRTAVWPAATLETALCGIWGEAAVGVFELAPLRRRDVAAAAEAAEIDADGFFRELYSASAVPFAIKPLTLNLLIALFRKDGRLPRSVADLYLRGCLKLCEEQNVGRRDARRLGTLTRPSGCGLRPAWLQPPCSRTGTRSGPARKATAYPRRTFRCRRSQGSASKGISRRSGSPKRACARRSIRVCSRPAAATAWVGRIRDMPNFSPRSISGRGRSLHRTC